MCIIIRNFTVFQYTFHLPQVKGDQISCTKNFVYSKTVKFWRGYPITQCLNVSSRITWSLLINPVLRQVTRVSSNLLPSLTKYTNHLMTAAKYGVHLLIYRKRFFFFLSKTFDKVWHQGLHYKLRQSSIFDELLNTLTDFLDNRTLRVILNGQYSSWTKVEAGVPQSSIFGPLLFLIYINDLSQNQTLNYLLVTPHSSL